MFIRVNGLRTDRGHAAETLRLYRAMVRGRVGGARMEMSDNPATAIRRYALTVTTGAPTGRATYSTVEVLH